MKKLKTEFLGELLITFGLHTMTEINMGYGIGFIIESGRITDLSGGCQFTPKELLTFTYENKATNRRRELYGCDNSTNKESLSYRNR